MPVRRPPNLIHHRRASASAGCHRPDHSGRIVLPPRQCRRLHRHRRSAQLPPAASRSSGFLPEQPGDQPVPEETLSTRLERVERELQREREERLREHEYWTIAWQSIAEKLNNLDFAPPPPPLQAGPGAVACQSSLPGTSCSAAAAGAPFHVNALAEGGGDVGDDITDTAAGPDPVDSPWPPVDPPIDHSRRTEEERGVQYKELKANSTEAIVACQVIAFILDTNQVLSFLNFSLLLKFEYAGKFMSTRCEMLATLSPPVVQIRPTTKPNCHKYYN